MEQTQNSNGKFQNSRQIRLKDIVENGNGGYINDGDPVDPFYGVGEDSTPWMLESTKIHEINQILIDIVPRAPHASFRPIDR